MTISNSVANKKTEADLIEKLLAKADSETLQAALLSIRDRWIALTAATSKGCPEQSD